MLITSGSIRCTLLHRSECCVLVYLQQMQLALDARCCSALHSQCHTVNDIIYCIVSSRGPWSSIKFQTYFHVLNLLGH